MRGESSSLVSAISRDDSGGVNIARLRAEISAEYWNVVDLVRAPLGVKSLWAQADSQKDGRASRQDTQPSR
jgi:hypothetical protein